VNVRRLSHFASKSVGGLTSRGEPEKSQKVSDCQRSDVSPSTQGLRYRAACDILMQPILIKSIFERI